MSKNHFTTTIAVFIALGIGIIIGGTVAGGEKEIIKVDSEQHLIDQVMQKYNEKVLENQQMKTKLQQLQAQHKEAAVFSGCPEESEVLQEE